MKQEQSRAGGFTNRSELEAFLTKARQQMRGIAKKVNEVDPMANQKKESEISPEETSTKNIIQPEK